MEKMSLNQVLYLGLLAGFIAFMATFFTESRSFEALKISMLTGGIGSFMFVFCFFVCLLQKEKTELRH